MPDIAIVAGGNCDLSLYKDILRDAYLIGADRGALYLAENGYQVDIAVGDHILDIGSSLIALLHTLYGDARGGRRPSYIHAAKPEMANELYERAVAAWKDLGIHVETGRFRTEMKVSLVNDGPVTILLDSEKAF